MYGWKDRPCTNLHGMYRWFGVIPLGCEVFFPSFFVVIFGAFSCAFVGGVLRMISRGFWWVSRMRTLCLFGW
jgi:membrane protein implicated in regulation of membrane protease activity